MSGTSKGCLGPTDPCTPVTVFNNLFFLIIRRPARATLFPYMALSRSHLTITDGTVVASSNAFTVGPAALASFAWSHVDDQTAGAQFHQTATAYDRFGNVKTNY